MRRAEKSRDLARKLDDVAENMRQRDKRGHLPTIGQFMAQNRTEAGGIVAIVVQEFEVTFGGIATGKRDKCRGVVIRHRMVHAAHDREAIDDLRRQRHVLADVNAGNVRGDRCEFAAHFFAERSASCPRCRDGWDLRSRR